MTFQVPASKASKGQDQFSFKIGTKSYSVKRLKFVPVGERFEISTDPGHALDFFGKPGTALGDAVRALNQDQFEALTQAWQDDSDVSLGGIASLCELIDRHKEAMEYDLIGLGLRLDWLGTPALSWRDLLVIVRQSPASSALKRAMFPDEAAWGLPEHLLAGIFDVLQGANWQRGGGKQRTPAPLPRPGVEPRDRKFGAQPISLDAMRKRLGWAHD